MTPEKEGLTPETMQDIREWLNGDAPPPARATVRQLLSEVERLAGSCSLCGREDVPRIPVHAECVVHRHDSPTGPPILCRQEEWAELWGRANKAERQLATYREALERGKEWFERMSYYEEANRVGETLSLGDQEEK